MAVSNGPYLWRRRSRRGAKTTLRDSGKRDRPVGVTVLAVLDFVGVGLAALVLLIALLTPRAAPEPDPTSLSLGAPFNDMIQRIEEEQASAQAAQLWILACSSAIEIPLGLVTGMGLWRLRSWARKLSMFFYGGGVILLLLVSFSRPISVSTLIGILTGGTAFVYLLQPHIRAAFSDRAPY
jgi:hypothetical protein